MIPYVVEGSRVQLYAISMMTMMHASDEKSSNSDMITWMFSLSMISAHVPVSSGI